MSTILLHDEQSDKLQFVGQPARAVKNELAVAGCRFYNHPDGQYRFNPTGRRDNS